VVLFATFLMMLVLAGLALAIGVTAHNSQLGGRSQALDRQAFYIAEAGWQRARQAINAGTWTAAGSPGNTYTEVFGGGEYQVTIVETDDEEYRITSDGYVPSQSSYVARRRLVEDEIDVTTSNTNLSPSATATASSADASSPASNVNDGSTSTKWKAGSNGNAWLVLDYASAVTVNQIVLKDTKQITTVTIEYSDNGSSWTSVSGLSVDEDDDTWTADFTAASHRYFRASMSVSSSKKAEVKEMESYNTASASLSLSRGDVTTQW